MVQVSLNLGVVSLTFELHRPGCCRRRAAATLEENSPTPSLSGEEDLFLDLPEEPSTPLPAATSSASTSVVSVPASEAASGRPDSLEQSQLEALRATHPAPLPLPISSVSLPHPPALSWAQRVSIAERTGLWVASRLANISVGSSPRSENSPQNRIWLVFRSSNGLVFDPVFKSWNWGACSHLVATSRQRGPRPGLLGSRTTANEQSIFIGQPSDREAEIVCEVAGVGW